MQPNTVEYVNAGDLFDTVAIVEEFSEGADDVTWGDASYTLISQDKFINILKEMDTIDRQAVSRTIERVKALPFHVYINLEA